jgi:hypothetical protein
MLSLRIHQGLPLSSRGWPMLRCFLVMLLATWAAGCASLPSNAVRPVSVAFNA